MSKRYTIEKIVGNGSYGEVAKAYDNEKNEVVCLVLWFHL